MLKALEDLILYLIENWRSLTVQGALTAVVLIIVKRIGIRQLKKLLRLKDNAEMERIEANVQRNESMLKLLLKERGIEWTSIEPNGLKPARTPHIGSFFSLSQVGTLLGNQRRLKRMLKKLSSRKFWALIAAVVTSCMVLFGYSEDVTLRVVALITNVGAVMVYLLVEGSIDKAREGGTPDESEESFGDHGPTV